MRRILSALLLLAALAPARDARAHEGPPYPVLVDAKVGPHTLSVWADPDLGTGTFFVIFDVPAALESEADPRVSVEVWPASGRAAPARYEARRQPDRAYVARVEFDREELWKARVRVEASLGAADTVFEVAVTPPGYGAWDLLIYLTPFLAVGGMWAAVSMKRRRYAERGRS